MCSGQFIKLSLPQFTPLQKGDDESHRLTGIWQKTKDLKYVKFLELRLERRYSDTGHLRTRTLKSRAGIISEAALGLSRVSPGPAHQSWGRG